MEYIMLDREYCHTELFKNENAFRVFFFILCTADVNNGSIELPKSEITKHTGLSYGKVRTAMDWLENRGYIKRTVRKQRTIITVPWLYSFIGVADNTVPMRR